MKEAVPVPADPSSIVWWYHPHSDEPSETNAGLMGPIIVTAKGKQSLMAHLKMLIRNSSLRS